MPDTAIFGGISGLNALILFAFFVCFIMISLLFKRFKFSSYPGAFIFTILIFILLSAVFPETSLKCFPETQLNRIVFCIFIMVIFVCACTIHYIENTALKEKYALMWIIPSIILFVMALFPQGLDFLKQALGMEYSSSMIAIVFAAMIFALFVISIGISSNEKKISEISQKCAILEARIKELENKVDKL